MNGCAGCADALPARLLYSVRGMMRLEYVGGRSREHWQAEQIGDSVVFRWGRIGRPERKTVKSFGSAELAAAELQRRQRAKLRKGWVQLWLPFQHEGEHRSPSFCQKMTEC